MREILFRGKGKYDGIWKYGSLERFMPDRLDLANYFILSETAAPNATSVIPETVGQFTGLTDKNGKKIFEGDIVKTHYANAPKSDFIETVVFHNGKFCAFHENNGCKQWAILYDGTPHLRIDKSVYMDSVEVIGNIHDNPELLKGD